MYSILLQAYRRDRLEYLTNIHNNSSGNFKIGIKLVRGAYMEKERKRAIRYNYMSPICDDKIHTDKIFNNSLEYIIQNIDDFDCLLAPIMKKVTFFQQSS